MRLGGSVSIELAITADDVAVNVSHGAAIFKASLYHNLPQIGRFQVAADLVHKHQKRPVYSGARCDDEKTRRDLRRSGLYCNLSL